MTRRMTRFRRLALPAVVVVTLLALLALLGPILLIAVAFWVPIPTLGSIFPEDELRLHLIHGVGLSIALWTVLVGVGLQLRRPERWLSPLWVAAIFIGVSAFVAALAGVFEPIFWVPFLVLVGLALILHPTPTASLSLVNRPAGLLAAMGTAPLVVYGYNQLILQFGGVAGDPHVGGAHYSSMAMLALIILIGAWLGSTDVPGRRVSGLIAGGSATLFGLASLVNPDQVSSWTPQWSIAAVVWGTAFLVIGSRSGGEGPASSPR